MKKFQIYHDKIYNLPNNFQLTATIADEHGWA